MSRDWLPILIDAGLRNLTTTELAREQACAKSTAFEAAKRWGVRLASGITGEKRSPHSRNRTKAVSTMHHRRMLWWRRELALAEAAQESLNTFCLRVRKSPKAAQTWASRLGHTFQKQRPHPKGPQQNQPQQTNTPNSP